MAIKELIPWNNKGREAGFQRATDVHPFFTLHREMNRMFDDIFRGFDLAPFGPTSRTLDPWRVVKESNTVCVIDTFVDMVSK
jgi:HSP20 family protein